MQLRNYGRVFSVLTVLAVLAAGAWYSAAPSVVVADDISAAAATSPFRGTYEGGYWGNVVGVGPYGGDIKCTVSTAGRTAITLPGAGTGTVATATGVYSATGSLRVLNKTVAVQYTGALKPIKHPTTGVFLGVVGNGTWHVTTPGITASGKWLIRRTLLTP